MNGTIDRILLIDDDIELTELIAQYLQTNGFLVQSLPNGELLEQTIDSFSPDVIVLDLMMPGIDGLTICRNIRDSFHGAIIMLTALDDDIDEVTGLEVGADDYLTKPLKPRVLLAHIRAQLRRQTKLQQTSSDTSIYCFDQQICIDSGKRQVQNNGKAISLSSAEFDLLSLLAQNVGQIVKREFLHEQIFRLPYDGIDRSIDLRVSRLRRKLGDDSKEPKIIKTVRNAGYLLSL